MLMRNARQEKAQAGIKIAGRSINKLRYADDTTVMAESEEELKSLLMKVKEESEEVGLKLNIQKTKITASDPITSWEIDGETVETVSDFIFWCSKITASPGEKLGQRNSLFPPGHQISGFRPALSGTLPWGVSAKCPLSPHTHGACVWPAACEVLSTLLFSPV